MTRAPRWRVFEVRIRTAGHDAARVFRPEGPNMSARAPPWVRGVIRSARPERAQQTAAVTYCVAFQGWRRVLLAFPGRCRWAGCGCPFGRNSMRNFRTGASATDAATVRKARAGVSGSRKFPSASMPVPFLASAAQVRRVTWAVRATSPPTISAWRKSDARAIRVPDGTRDHELARGVYSKRKNKVKNREVAQLTPTTREDNSIRAQETPHWGCLARD